MDDASMRRFAPACPAPISFPCAGSLLLPPVFPPTLSSAATDAVYLVCAELSGDSSVIALRPSDGATAWALSSSSVAAYLAPVRAAAAAPGIIVYADTGSRLTAVGAASGALLWQVGAGHLTVQMVERWLS